MQLTLGKNSGMLHADCCMTEEGLGIRAELNRRVSHLLKKPTTPIAEAGSDPEHSEVF